MATIRHPLVIRRAAILALLLGAGPALAQGPAQDPAGSRAGRSLTATGQTKPPGTPASASAAAPVPKPVSASEMAKAQKAAEARSKAWDVRTKRSMSSICNGC